MNTNNKGDETTDNKSHFLTAAEKMQVSLGTALCLAKWKQVSLHLTTGLNNSCYHPPLHRIPVDAIGRNPAALHNTDYKKQQRKQMLAGERPAECSYCWTMEDNGKLSDRHYRSGESWAAKDFGTIVNAEWDADITPSYVEVNFNNACNLACSYCSPQFSSTWQQETDRHGAYPTSTPHNAPEHFAGDRKPIPVREHNPYVEAFWSWWPTLYPELEHFRMTGGEPLLDKNTYRVFDYVLANPKPDLHLNVTSNFSVDEKSWQRYLAEYMRHGMDFELVWSRVNQFLTEVPSRNSVTFIVTMNNLGVTSLPELLDGIIQLRKKYSSTYQRVWFDTPVLRQPTWQSLQLLPESYVAQLEKLKTSMQQNIETEATRFHGFKDYEIARLDRDIAWMRDGQRLDPAYLQRNKADFYRFFTEADRRHGTEFVQAFPEMQSWWAECEYYARQS